MKKFSFLITLFFIFTFFYESSYSIIRRTNENQTVKYEKEEPKKIYKEEHIESLRVDIQINKDGSLLVNEIINYNSVQKSVHGIYRDIPVSGNFLKEKIKIKMNYITRNGNAEPYKKIKDLNVEKYRIGSQNKYVSGKNEYILNYTVYNALRKTGKDSYELDWNAIGQYWNLKILNGEIDIHFNGNKNIFSYDSNFEAYSGKLGAKEKNFVYKVEPDNIKIKTTKVLNNKEGLSFFLKFKTEEINDTFWLKVSDIVYNDQILFFSVLFFISAFILMFLRLITLKKKSEVDVDRYRVGIPEDVSSMLVAYVNYERNENEIVSIGILALISKKHLKIVPNTEGDSFELLESNIELTEEEKELKEILSKQEISIENLEEIVEKKIKEVLEKKNVGNKEDINYLKDEIEKNFNEKTYIKKFSKIPNKDFYNFKKNLFTILNNKTEKITEKDKYSFIFSLGMLGVTGYAEYLAVSEFTNSTGAGFGITINLFIWTAMLLTMFISKKPKKRLWVWGMLIGICFYIASKNILMLVIWLLYGIIQNIYKIIKLRYTEYGADVVQKIKKLENYIQRYKDDMKLMTSSTEINNYLGNIYPYILALGKKNEMNKLINNLNSNYFVTVSEIKRNFETNFNYTIIKRNIVTKNSSSSIKNSSSGGRSSSSSSHSSGSGHGGGGGGSW